MPHTLADQGSCWYVRPPVVVAHNTWPHRYLTAATGDMLPERSVVPTPSGHKKCSPYLFFVPFRVLIFLQVRMTCTGCLSTCGTLWRRSTGATWPACTARMLWALTTSTRASCRSGTMTGSCVLASWLNGWQRGWPGMCLATQRTHHISVLHLDSQSARAPQEDIRLDPRNATLRARTSMNWLTQ